MRRKILASIGLVAIALGAYFFAGSIERNTSKEKGAQDIKQLVEDYSAGSIKTQSASITSHELIVTDGDSNSQTYDLPQNEFFVSIAPYVEKSHPCATHSLTGCRGELAEKEFDLSIEDMKGNTILEQTMKSKANGFIDLWLPRNKKYRITITYNGKTAESEFSTFEGDNTCITTLQLTDKSA
ncbi:CueP family metal-binding protein [Paenibacillus caui]|uniref:CueP family metal-binding protein n=1 Tax=Paenibacillus caui TaxID=2873927 RepID=UPI001CA8DDD3|nr:CueP family metal-binding protein [Paenibacillus caui]